MLQNNQQVNKNQRYFQAPLQNTQQKARLQKYGRQITQHIQFPRLQRLGGQFSESIGSIDQKYFDMKKAPVLIPEGPWELVEGSLTAPKGFLVSGIFSGLRYSGKKADLALIFCESDCCVGATFTTNQVYAAPVAYDKKLISNTQQGYKAVIINAGQANAATGDQGIEDCEKISQELAKILKINPEQVLIQSTGVIGRRIEMENYIKGLPSLVQNLGTTLEHDDRATIAITTTDLVHKKAALRFKLGESVVTLGGTCKGSGMIHPNMATMLCNITTDAKVDSQTWQEIVKRGVQSSFNQISVDGDQSTNDTVLGMASGLAQNCPYVQGIDSQEGQALLQATTALLQGLSKSVAWDGEGATCLLEVLVEGADSQQDAEKVARSIIQSSLLKAAIYGHDPNWGRIACAAGYAGVPFDQKNLDIKLGTTGLMKNGQPLQFDQKVASNYLKDTTSKHGTVNIDVNIGNGKHKGKAWGCDLSYEYVRINAEYTS